MTGIIEIYVDHFWWKMGNQEIAKQMVIDKLPEGVTDYVITDQIVKRGCAPEVYIVLKY